MEQNISRSEVCSPPSLVPPPCNPPVEIVEQGYVWVLEEFQSGSRDGTTYSTHDGRMDALRAGKRLLDDQHHPCLLRWDAPDSVRDLYWNPLFEDLLVRHDDMVDTWVVTPEASDFLFQTAHTRKSACEYAKVVQREFDFKHLTVYDRNGAETDTRDHRFLRYSITRPDVRFSQARREETEPTDSEDEDETEEGQPSVPSELVASIPDLTAVEILDGDGPLYRYDSPWTEGGRVRIVALSADHGDHEQLVDAVTAIVENWERIDQSEAVATVLDSGEQPAPWVVYRSGDSTLAERGYALDTDQRVDALGDVASALMAADGMETTRLGVAPDHVRLHLESEPRATLADWGLEWTVARAVDDAAITRYTAPEQVQGEESERTCVYQLGALAYWLLCETEPFSDASNLERAIQTGDLTPPGAVGDVPGGVADVVERAMAPRPEERYETVRDMYYELQHQYE